jgi:hypothetical protein
LKNSEIAGRRSQVGLAAPSIEAAHYEVSDLSELLVDCTEVATRLLAVVTEVFAKRRELRARVCLMGGKLLAERVDGLTVGVSGDRDVAQSLVNAVDPRVERVEAGVDRVEAVVDRVEAVVDCVETRGDAVELRAETIDALTKCSNRGQYRAVVGSVGFQGRDPCFEITKRSHELSLSSPTDLVERQRWACRRTLIMTSGAAVMPAV